MSRVTPTPVEEDGSQLPIVAVNLIMSNLPVSSTEIELFHEETSKDPTLTLLRCYIHMGWPNDRRMLPQELHTFWNYTEDLSMEDMDLSQKGPDSSYLPHLGRRYWNRYMKDIWVLKSACSKQEILYSGQAFPMISMQDCGKMWNLSSKFQSS